MALNDPLQLLRTAIVAEKLVILTRSSDPSSAEAEQTESWTEATHLYFTSPTPVCVSLSTPTRFFSHQQDNAEIDLRSVYFAWTNKDLLITDYVSSAVELDKDLPDDRKLRYLVFSERIELIAWLEGGNEISDFVKPAPAPSGEQAIAKAADVAAGAGVPTVAGTGEGIAQQDAAGKKVKVIDARLQAIYNGERRMGDHNTILRGSKPTVCGHQAIRIFLLTETGLLLSQPKMRRHLRYSKAENRPETQRRRNPSTRPGARQQASW